MSVSGTDDEMGASLRLDAGVDLRAGLILVVH